MWRTILYTYILFFHNLLFVSQFILLVALFLISWQEVSLLNDAVLLPQSVTDLRTLVNMSVSDSAAANMPLLDHHLSQHS